MEATNTTDQAQDNPFKPLLHTPVPTTNQDSKNLYSPVAFDLLLLFNALSILCSFGCILLLVCLRRQHGSARRWSQQPVSIRLILLASIIDVFYSMFRVYDMVISQSDTRPDSQQNCEAAMFGLTLFSLLSVFVRALLSVHLHAVIVYRVNRPLSYEKRFIISSFLLSLLLALLPLTRFSYAWINYDPTLGSGHCSYFSLESVPRDFNPNDMQTDDARRAVVAGLLWCWATYFGWLALTLAYCIVVIAAVIYRLCVDRRRTAQLIAQHQQALDGRNAIAVRSSNTRGIDSGAAASKSGIKNSANRSSSSSSSSSNRGGGDAPDAESGPRQEQRLSSAAATPAVGSRESDGAEYMLVFARWSKERKEVWRLAKKVLRRVAQFPATIIICHSLEVAWATATLTRILTILRTGAAQSTGDLKRLYVAMQAMLASQGIITLLSLCLEPAIKALFVQWWGSWYKASLQERASLGNTAHAARDGTERLSFGRLHSAAETASFNPLTLDELPWDIVVCDTTFTPVKQ
ncbi:hypothetical protein GQ54DRAFT_196557 [Martensiomyces pterosporus]|nr:hypothetical protein GQ54DRAFT_196557 [Martensiomyces pterosporus]